MNEVIQKAISIAGSQSELARRVGVDQSAVSKWLFGGGIRAHYIPAIVKATQGEISVDEVINSLGSHAVSENIASS
ncbi:phage transcriptional regulator [Yersinia intermedia]|uniref:YdaS family helix-turn-helix protein n=1 Tax=Yersinia intermedia TaxID=631 RepID=UPI0005DF0E49|nr:YdaS family helix-turn-helix protein [Yersinia intermedia]MDA5495424.1 YdaS family helix-turn-helix protein [Yersinia intermedia]CNH14599.1 phage transcriptional regulator [Yersinia intermedia]CQD78121.1 phage transcriptional regulator [Yersinia intermedia]